MTQPGVKSRRAHQFNRAHKDLPLRGVLIRRGVCEMTHDALQQHPTSPPSPPRTPPRRHTSPRPAPHQRGVVVELSPLPPPPPPPGGGGPAAPPPRRHRKVG